ncbi:ABC transporter ATP-binding protein [Chroococcidiopsis sp. CCALA 051]|uniref:ATP-binding cassette domain-containing protein n=1 Tax=Chroococcidiopsis sp. CCALA 051 TaxID=869949 RepID=UPI000D0E24CD|nr:ATP-binding cassette domain-containing protein [Chroococcidiopsis sp. CCALA 051]MBE9017362.1 ATP-binding cassette domain-containing protein [Chroococcidiopsidales cyanobacterium LEGE 13417]PSM48661.1 ABC transporter ATP-binding protein [Chroococcidiopsis sp. CCALA 051]
MTDKFAVIIRRLNYYFGQGDLRTQVLSDINLDLPKGQIVIMTGPSGSGKTTLLSLIGALRSAHEGNLLVLEKELVGLNKSQLVEIRRNIGFIFQAHNLFESLTASQNVEMAVELTNNWREKRKLAVEMLSQLGLANRVDYKPNALSGGQKQRVAIARALVNQPQLILADEPTAALDKKSGREVVTLMQQLAKEQGCTILIVTHDNSILDVADRIINLVEGRLESDENLENFVSTRDPKSIDRRMFS